MQATKSFKRSRKVDLFKVTVKVTLRKSILDPQGKATQQALGSLGFSEISGIRIGKLLELDIDAPDEQSARASAERACDRLLANPVMDDFEVISITEMATAVVAG